jgi:hypothetical protein
MAQVRAKVRVFVDNTLRDAGDIFEYKGTPNRHLEVLNGDLEEIKETPAAIAEAPRPRGRPRKAMNSKRGAAGRPQHPSLI